MFLPICVRVCVCVSVPLPHKPEESFNEGNHVTFEVKPVLNGHHI